MLLSNVRPADEKLASLCAIVPAPVEMTQGAELKGLRLISSVPLLPAANTTVTPLAVTALVTM